MYADAVRSLSPTAFWRLSEASWTTLVDSSGNGHNGYGDSTSYTLSQAGLTYGDKSAGMLVPTATPGGGARVTQASWMENVLVSWVFPIKMTTMPTGDRGTFVSRRGFGGGTPYSIYLDTTAQGGFPLGAINLLLGTAAGGFGYCTSTNVSVIDSTTHLYGLTIDGSGSTMTAKTYLDGQLKHTGTLGGGPMPSSGVLVSGSDMSFGAEGGASPYNRGLCNVIQDMAYWAGTVLTAPQIALLWKEFTRGAVSY